MLCLLYLHRLPAALYTLRGLGVAPSMDAGHIWPNPNSNPKQGTAESGSACN